MDIVVDTGSQRTKAGPSGPSPAIVTPTLVGRPRHGNPASDVWHVGDEAYARRETLALTYPIGDGLVQNWQAWRMVWEYVFGKLGQPAGSCRVLMLDRAGAPLAQRENAAVTFIDGLGVSGLFFSDTATEVARAAGKATALVVEVGHSVTQAVAVHEATVLPATRMTFDVSGQTLTDFLVALFAERHLSFTTVAEKELVAHIKETTCLVATDHDAAFDGKAPEVPYELPDGQILRVFDERVRCPEALFDASLVGMERWGLPNTVHEAITRADPEMRSQLYGNVLLAGGTALLPELAPRMTKELGKLAPPGTAVNVSVSEASHAAWTGGARYLDGGGVDWITQSEWETSGLPVVAEKCPV